MFFGYLLLKAPFIAALCQEGVEILDLKYIFYRLLFVGRLLVIGLADTVSHIITKILGVTPVGVETIVKPFLGILPVHLLAELFPELFFMRIAVFMDAGIEIIPQYQFADEIGGAFVNAPGKEGVRRGGILFDVDQFMDHNAKYLRRLRSELAIAHQSGP